METKMIPHFFQSIPVNSQPRKLKISFAVLLVVSTVLVLANLSYFEITSALLEMTPLPETSKAMASSLSFLPSFAEQKIILNQSCTNWLFKNQTWRDSVTDTGSPYQCVNVPGRLGNALFTYASSVGVALLGNRTVVVRANNPLLSLFKIRAVVDCEQRLCEHARRKKDGACCRFKPSILDPERDTPVLAVGAYLQSWRYFQHAEGEVRRQITPYGVTAEKAEATIRALRGELERDGGGPVTLVGMHVRQGDIVRSARLVTFGYQVPSVDYFRRAMAWFLQRYPRAVFLVSSNMKDYVEKEILPLCGGDLVAKNGSLYGVGFKKPDAPENTSAAAAAAAAGGDAGGVVVVGGNASLLQSDKEAQDTAILSLEDDENAASKKKIPNTEEAKKRKTVTKGRKRRKPRQQAEKKEPDRDTGEAPTRHRRSAHDTRHPDRVPVPGARCRWAGSSSVGVDLAVLGMCQHAIMSVGTYGWWAGWLTGGRVVYYRNPARPGTPYFSRFHGPDFFPPHWVPME